MLETPSHLLSNCIDYYNLRDGVNPGLVLEDRGVWPRPERVCAAGRLARDAVSDSGGLRTVEADWE